MIEFISHFIKGKKTNEKIIMDVSYIKTIKSGTQWLYTWSDKYGSHEYYQEGGKVSEILMIFDFKRERLEQSIIYSWRDNLGVHKHCEFISNGKQDNQRSIQL